MHEGNSFAAAVSERRRVRQHLAGAEKLARARSSGVGAGRALQRSLLLDELARYRRRGRFPLNQQVRGRAVPVFVDAHGSRCAVAHLLDITGQRELVRHIAQTDNHARVSRLARLPELRAWLAAAGLSLDEASRIQPTYCSVTEADACFCAGSGLSNLVLGSVVSVEDSSVQVRADRVDGDFPDLRVGDLFSLAGSGELGEQILFSRASDGSVSRVGSRLTLQGGTAHCLLNPETAKRSVSIDTTFQALRADSSGCVSVLTADQSAWNNSQCTGSESQSDGGCGFAAAESSGIGAAGLTSVALLAALLRYRRRVCRAQVASSTRASLAPRIQTR